MEGKIKFMEEKNINPSTSSNAETEEELILKILQNSKKKSNKSIDSGGVSSSAQVEKVIKDLLDRQKMSSTSENIVKVKLTIAHLCQIGATSPKFSSTRTIMDYGCNFTAGNLTEVCKKNDTTVRKLARALRDLIVTVASQNNLEGNLSKTYKLDYPNHDKQDLIWTSDFQTFSDNPAMPTHVSEWLLENYKKRFRPEPKGQSSNRNANRNQVDND